MRLAANLAACALMLAAAWFLYAEGTATRRLEAHVQGQERQRERLENDIAVLKAERAHLSRSERIEPLARAQGMKTPTADSYRDLDDVLAGRPGTPRKVAP